MPPGRTLVLPESCVSRDRYLIVDMCCWSGFGGLPLSSKATVTPEVLRASSLSLSSLLSDETAHPIVYRVSCIVARGEELGHRSSRARGLADYMYTMYMCMCGFMVYLWYLRTCVTSTAFPYSGAVAQ